MGNNNNLVFVANDEGTFKWCHMPYFELTKLSKLAPTP